MPFLFNGISCLGLAYGSGLHLLAYAESGELFTWGYNTYSQLGNGTTNHTLSPSIVGGVLAGKSILQVVNLIVNRFFLYLLKIMN